MAEEIYYGNEMALTIDTSSGTNLPVGVLKGVEITPGVEVDELWGADSIKRQAVNQREFSVAVTVSMAAYDVTMIQQWLGGSGSSSTSIADTNDPALFSIKGEVTPYGGSTNLIGDVVGVYFPDMPLFGGGASEGAYIEEELSGAGEDVTVTGP